MPETTVRTATFLLCAILIESLCCADGDQPLVSVREDGRLQYAADDRGNRIPDFSRAGYGGGGVSLPDLPAVRRLGPIAGDADDTDRVQAALDDVARQPPHRNGARGAVLLERGTYRIGGTLRIAESGVVLRGAGQGPDGTILVGTGRTQRTLIALGGPHRIEEVKRTRHAVVDSHVPWGAGSLTLESTTGLAVGDRVIVFRPSTEKWIHDLKMDQIKGKEGTQQWRVGEYDLSFERTIMAVRGNAITLDAPLVTALEAAYGGGAVFGYKETGRIVGSGVENIRLVSKYEKGRENSDEDHAWTGVALNGCRDCWVRNLTTVHFSHAVNLDRGAIFVTVQDCACLAPVSLITGGRRYAFSINGQFCLVQRCYSDEVRHAEATGSRVAGPNVFLDCLTEHSHTDTGPHHRWAVGILWDNLKGGTFNVQDRGDWGSGHGWAGAQQVFWNCETSSICVQQPPTGQNYAIGCTGAVGRGRLPDRPPGHYESHGRHVTPRSLYLAQLEDRLGRQAVINVTTEEQRAGTVYDRLKATLSE